MVNDGKNRATLVMSDSREEFDRQYGESLKTLLSRIKRQRRRGMGKSIRETAKELKLTHPTLISLMKNPGRPVSRGTKKKVIRGVYVAPKKKKRIFHPDRPVGKWFSDAK